MPTTAASANAPDWISALQKSQRHKVLAWIDAFIDTQILLLLDVRYLADVHDSMALIKNVLFNPWLSILSLVVPLSWPTLFFFVNATFLKDWTVCSAPPAHVVTVWNTFCRIPVKWPRIWLLLHTSNPISWPHLSAVRLFKNSRTFQQTQQARVIVTELAGHMLVWFSLPLLTADLYQALSPMSHRKIQLCGFYHQWLSTCESLSSAGTTAKLLLNPASMLFHAQLF